MTQPMEASKTDAYFTRLVNEAGRAEPMPWQSVARLMFAYAKDQELEVTRLKEVAAILIESLRRNVDQQRRDIGDGMTTAEEAKGTVGERGTETPVQAHDVGCRLYAPFYERECTCTWRLRTALSAAEQEVKQMTELKDTIERAYNREWKAREAAELRASQAEEAISSMIAEISWFVSRRVNLSAKPKSEPSRTWAEILNADLDIGRRALSDQPKEG